MIANDQLFNNIGGYFLCAAYLMGLISVKQFYLISIILVLEKHGASPCFLGLECTMNPVFLDRYC